MCHCGAKAKEAISIQFEDRGLDLRADKYVLCKGMISGLDVTKATLASIFVCVIKNVNSFRFFFFFI